MELSLFLAKLIGLYLLIIAALWVLRKKAINPAIADFVSSKGLLLFAGAINIIAGLAIAIAHPIWEPTWRGLITLIAYLMIFQGIMRFAFPEKVQHGAKKMVAKGFWPAIGVLVILGAFLTYNGFVG